MDEFLAPIRRDFAAMTGKMGKNHGTTGFIAQILWDIASVVHNYFTKIRQRKANVLKKVVNADLLLQITGKTALP